MQTGSGNTEPLVANLDPDRFPHIALKVLYARRRGIETSFRNLKYAVGLIHLHAKKPDLVLQEIFSSFLIFNFLQTAAWAVGASQRTAKYKRHVNFSAAVFACCAFLRCAAPPLIRSRSSGEDYSRFVPDALPQGQKSRVTAFPPAMPPLADLFYILFLTELPPSALAASFSDKFLQYLLRNPMTFCRFFLRGQLNDIT